MGRCLECDDTFDELCGSRLCARPGPRLFPRVKTSWREYHCRKKHTRRGRHSYFTFFGTVRYTATWQQQMARSGTLPGRTTAQSRKSRRRRRGGCRHRPKLSPKAALPREWNPHVARSFFFAAPNGAPQLSGIAGLGYDGRGWSFFEKKTGTAETPCRRGIIIVIMVVVLVPAGKPVF